MKKFIAALSLAILSACGGDKKVEQEIVLDDFKDRIGYVLGALNAESILKSGEKMKDMNLEKMVLGFNENLNEKDCSDCDDVLMDLFGPYFQDFDTTHVEAGSKCLGQKTAFAFYADMIRMGGAEKINLDMVKVGFEHGLFEKDTLIDETEKRTMVQNFILDLNVVNGDKMMADAKAIEGVQVFDNGIVLQTIEEGKGDFPGATDDVEVEYILTSSLGDTVQSSYQMKQMKGSDEPVYLSLNGGVIPGWSFVLPKMKVGGKYRTYIPWELAYGEQGGKESLCFFIELKKSAPQGTFIKPNPENFGGMQ